MKCLKITTLLAIAAAASMAFAGIAMADSATSPTGTTYTSTADGQSEGHYVLDNPIAKIECQHEFKGVLNAHGPGLDIIFELKETRLFNCTNEWHFTTVAAGTLRISGIAGSYNGDVFSTGETIEATRFGITCRYATNNTTIGTLTAGSPATIDVSGSLPFHSGSVFCGSGATAMTGSMTLSSPSALYIDNN